MLLANLFIYLLAFAFIWLGAGLVVSAVDRFSKKLRLSSFAVSFVVLGLLTSTPEFAVGLTAVTDNTPEIFVGNLIGGIAVIFLLIIPILAIFGNGIRLNHSLDRRSLLFSLAVVAAPSLLILDKKVSTWEGIFLIIIYIILVVIVERKHGFFDKKNGNVMNIKAYSYKDFLKVLLGIGILFVASEVIVDKTLYFSEIFNIPAFYISLILLSLGTNLPELSLAIRSIISGKKDVAFGDYMGSAAANTFLFGVFTLLSRKEVLTANNFLTTSAFIVGGLLLFYYLTRFNNILSRRSGMVLLFLYLMFVLIEFRGL